MQPLPKMSTFSHGPSSMALEDVRLQRGNTCVFDGLTLALHEPRIGLIGDNGAGKSSLFRLLSGLDRPQAGRVHVPEGAQAVGMMFQNPDDQIIFPTVEEELALSLNVSEDTVRRDIEVLAKSGLLVKVRGGAISPSASPLSFQDRADMFPDAKKVIALKAQQQLLGAKTVFIDGGTTMLAFISSIPIVANFRLITNNIALLPLLSTHQGIEVIVLGGNYDRSTQTNVGVQTCLEAQKYQADVYFMGACSIDRQIGITASIQDEGEVKKILMASARKTIVLSNKEND